MAPSVGTDQFLLPFPALAASYGNGLLPTIRDNDQVEAFRHAWQQLIDNRLIEGGSNLAQFDDEGIEPPSRATIARAIKLAQQCQTMGYPAPVSIVPDANGGIVFERSEEDLREVFHVWDDGCTEYQIFRGSQLVERTLI